MTIVFAQICHIALMMLKPVISNPNAHEMEIQRGAVWQSQRHIRHGEQLLTCNSSLAAIRAKLSAEQFEQFKIMLWPSSEYR
ncbi:hypothetical protein Prudu_016872 [Prunus dulcis]|uniref:Uncharacterized protein n=1 Tax=Prunus dulcis TaxID=3755 RepID=A0A4Y1RMP7_PRUDU|nr:hypothetical protein Prudu_016872 [Prunus dulcis]